MIRSLRFSISIVHVRDLMPGLHARLFCLTGICSRRQSHFRLSPDKDSREILPKSEKFCVRGLGRYCPLRSLFGVPRLPQNLYPRADSLIRHVKRVVFESTPGHCQMENFFNGDAEGVRSRRDRAVQSPGASNICSRHATNRATRQS